MLLSSALVMRLSFVHLVTLPVLLSHCGSKQDRPSVVALSYRSAVPVELFLDGKSLIRSPTAVALVDIDDRNNWLGESQWSKDHCYHGSYDEFRIYSVALTGCQLRTLVARGPDAL